MILRLPWSRWSLFIFITIIAHRVVFTIQTRRMQVIKLGLVKVSCFHIISARALVMETFKHR